MTSSTSEIDRHRQALRLRFGSRLREIRSARGIWQQTLGDAAGISASAISRIEHAVAEPGLSQALLIVDRLLGVSTLERMMPDGDMRKTMSLGPGKYDDVCTMARERVGIGERGKGGVILIVIGGDRGQGFSCLADCAATLALPEILESIAAAIRLDTAA